MAISAVKKTIPMTNAASDLKNQSPEASPNPLAVLKPARAPRLYTLAEFMRKEEKALHKHEYHNGNIIKMPNAKHVHNRIAANLIIALGYKLTQSNPAYSVYTSDQMIYIPSLNMGLYPDAMVICETPLFHDKDERLLLNPTMVVEVLSDSTRKHDRSNKFDYYKTIPSFREYVLIEQDKVSVESRFRVEPNLWREQKITEAGASITFDSIHITLSMTEIYHKVPGLLE